MSPITYRKLLDNEQCHIPDCNHEHDELYLHSKCHPHRGIEACYLRGTGILVVNCKSCHAEVCRFEIK